LKANRASFGWYIALLPFVIILFSSTLAPRSQAQTASAPQSHPKHRAESPNGAGDHTIPALFVSDIHFDPFHDPARLPQLVAAPVNQWSAILAAPSSPNQQQAFESLQQQCHARGVDTSYALLHSSLQAMKTRQPDANFMTVSGDLIAHAFECRYKTLLPTSTHSDYQAFVLKTISFVVGELRNSFPGMPVYMALGNNDSGCGDYKLDSGSDFFKQTGKILAEGLPLPAQKEAAEQFAAGGYYSVAMATPMRATRLIVINDTFLSPKYTTCSGAPAPNAEDAQIDWLKKQLNEAREAHQNAWILGHVPPGVNVPSTIAKMKNVCAKAKPEMYLASGALTDDLTANADLIHLAIFAHTHMDELRLLRPQDDVASSSSEHDVAIKMVPSISPVDGNNPAFTIAKVNPSKAILQDYEVISASNQTGIDTTWSLEYEFAKAYHETEFSAASLKELIGEFKNDRDSNQDISAAYIRNFFVGDRSVLLKPFWPQYVCGLANSTATSFAACMCGTDK
jgi:sphingomyelin phosphodiesterase acid-like 3